MRDDKSPCKCHDRKNESLAYSLWLGRSMVLGSLQCLGVLLFGVIVGQIPAVLAAGAGWDGWLHCFFSHLSCLPFSLPFSEDMAWPDYNLVDWAVD